MYIQNLRFFLYNKKEVQTSSQLENENIQEDTIKEQTNKTLLTKEMLSQNNYKFLLELVQFRISGEKYYSEGDYLKLAVRHQYENKFIVHTIILSNKHITQPDYQLKSVLSNSEYEKMYYLTKNITKEKIYYACFELKDNVYLEDVMGAEYPNGLNAMFNIQGEKIVEIPNGTDDYTANQIAQRVADELDRYYEKLKNNEPIDTSSSTNNSSNTNSTVVADIQDRIDFFNSYYAWNFHPTDEQMQQMVEFANSTSNFTNDTLADFIIDKGWLPDSGTGTVSSNNSSSTTNNGNSSSSNKNTSSNNNTSQKEKPQPVVNVTVDPYSYLSKEEQNRIYENNETKKFNIVIKFNGKTIKSDTITYTGDNYVAPTYKNLKVDSESGTLTVEVNGETIKYTDGAKSVSVSMYLMSDEWTANTFDFYDITKMMG